MILPHFCLIPQPMLFLLLKEFIHKNIYAIYRLNFLDQIFKLVHIKIGKKNLPTLGTIFRLLFLSSIHFNIFVNDKQIYFCTSLLLSALYCHLFKRGKCTYLNCAMKAFVNTIRMFSWIWKRGKDYRRDLSGTQRKSHSHLSFTLAWLHVLLFLSLSSSVLEVKG